MARNELKTLTSLRGVAAILVAALHVPGLFGVKVLAPHAYLAVDFFFVLSGFVLSHAYGRRIWRREMDLGGFAKVRLARLYPLYALATLAGAALLALRIAAHTVGWNAHTALTLPLNLAFLPALASPDNPNGAIYPLEVQGWSLLWELVVGVALFAWLRTGLRGLEAVVGAAFALLIVCCWNRASLDGGWNLDTFWIGGVRALFGFAAGAFVRRMIDILSPRRRALGWGALLAGAVALAYILVAPAPNLPVELALVTLGFPILVAGAALTTRTWLTGGVFEATGQASYSIYLLHGPLGVATGMVLSRLHLAPGAWQPLFGSLWMVALVGVSWLSWRHLEEPLRQAWQAGRWPRLAAPRRRTVATTPAWG